MKKYILMVLGIITVLYGFMILGVGSGTKFWLVWEAIGAGFFLWALLLHKKFFVLHKGIGTIFYSLIAIAIAVVTVLCSLIVSEFTSKGRVKLDYIIVLGAQVRENGPSVVLKYRLDAAMDYLNENPDTKCIVSGGKGENEPFSEAEGMADYLIKNGMDSSRILLEEKSKNTVENILYSKGLLEEPYQGVGIVTNNFHVFRAVQIAKAQGLNGVCGIAAESHRVYLPNNVLRECMGILKDWLLGNL